MTDKNYALIKNTLVSNIIVADDSTDLKALFPEYKAVEFDDGVFCQAGSWYNAADGRFYDDPAFTVDAGTSPPVE